MMKTTIHRILILWVHFIIAVCCWAWGLNIIMAYVQVRHHCRKLFSFVDCQHERAFLLRMETCVYFPLSGGTTADLDLWRPSTCCLVSVSHVDISVFFLGAFHSLWFLPSFYILSCVSRRFYGSSFLYVPSNSLNVSFPYCFPYPHFPSPLHLILPLQHAYCITTTTFSILPLLGNTSLLH